MYECRPMKRRSCQDALRNYVLLCESWSYDMSDVRRTFSTYQVYSFVETR